MTPLERLEEAFQAASSNRDYAEFPSPPTFAFAPVRHLVKDADVVRLSDRMKFWALDNPAMFETLMLSLWEEPELHFPTAWVVAHDLEFWAEYGADEEEVEDLIDRFFIESLGKFDTPVRDWILQRPGLHRPLRLQPGIDFVPMESEQPAHLQWPDDEVLPPIDDPKGVQARLARLGYAVGPIDGEWGERSRRALYRLQFESGHPAPSGAMDAPTRRRLQSVK